MEKLALGVFLPCLAQRDIPSALSLAKEMGFSVIQLGADAFFNYSGESEKENFLRKSLKASGLEVVALFAGFPGERYDDIPTVRETVGFANKEKIPERVDIAKRTAEFTARLGIPAMAAHVGFIPPDPKDPLYDVMLSAVGEVVAHCEKLGLYFAFETGQETPEELKEFIERLGYPNSRVNFDTANLILYGKAFSVEGIEVLKDYIISTHMKDGVWPEKEGLLGHEVILGEGQANIEECLKKFIEIGYEGPLIIEREAGEDRVADIRREKEYLESLKKKYLG